MEAAKKLAQFRHCAISVESVRLPELREACSGARQALINSGAVDLAPTELASVGLDHVFAKVGVGRALLPVAS